MRPTLCHAGGRAMAGESSGDSAVDRATVSNIARERTPTDNFPARRESNAESRAVGARFEAHALVYLQRQRLMLVARNVHCRGGEIDLVMRDRDGTLVFVEVRARSRLDYGGAAASVGWQKQQRILRAARYFLATDGARQSARARGPARAHAMPPCRFDVIAFERGRLVWLRDAFRAGDR
jgi:putative endonuclease